MFFRRGVAEDDPWLRPKMWLFTIGALLAVVGMAMENDWLIGAGGLVLAAGFVLRFVPAPKDDDAAVDAADGPEGGAVDPSAGGEREP